MESAHGHSAQRLEAKIGIMIPSNSLLGALFSRCIIEAVIGGPNASAVEG
jgi:hypothetical protein